MNAIAHKYYNYMSFIVLRHNTVIGEKMVLDQVSRDCDIYLMEGEISNAVGNDGETNFTLRRTPFIYQLKTSQKL
jgi:hypothetical protein